MHKWHRSGQLASTANGPADIRSPMLASLSEPPVAQRGLVYEPKYDGIRAIVEIVPASEERRPTSLSSRETATTRPRSSRPSRRALATRQAAEGHGRARRRNRGHRPRRHPLGFQHIQGRIHLTAAPTSRAAERDQPAALIVFDLLRDGRRGPARPAARRAAAASCRSASGRAARKRPWVRLSEIALDDGRALLQRARAGRLGRPHRQGSALAVSQRQAVAGVAQDEAPQTAGVRRRRLDRAAPVATAFRIAARGLLRRRRRVALGGSGRHGIRSEGTRSRLRRCCERAKTRSPVRRQHSRRPRTPHWVKPTLVAEVRFTEWTSDGLLRQPVYLGHARGQERREIRREDARSQPTPAVQADGQLPEDTVRVQRKPRSEARGQTEAGRQKSAGLDAISHIVARLNELETRARMARWRCRMATRCASRISPRCSGRNSSITKGELLRYYAEVSPLLLPAVDDRPMVMRRFPNGVDKQAFYQQRHPEAPPPGVRREVLPADIEPIDEEGPRDRLIGGSLTTLLYMAQLAAISQDPWFSRVSDPLARRITWRSIWIPAKARVSTRCSTSRAG